MIRKITEHHVPRGYYAAELASVAGKLRTWVEEHRPFMVNTAADILAQTAACTGRLDDLTAALAVFESDSTIAEVVACAVCEAHPEIVRYVLPKLRNCGQIQRCVKLAAQSGCRETADAMLEHGPCDTFGCRGSHGQLAISSALSVGDDTMVEHLLEKFPDKHILDAFPDEDDIMEAVDSGSFAALEHVRALANDMSSRTLVKVMERAICGAAAHAESDRKWWRLPAGGRVKAHVKAYAEYAALAMEFGAPPTPAALELVSRKHPAAEAVVTVAAVLRRWGGTAELTAAVDQLPGARWYAAVESAAASDSE